jgi:putative hemolysin
VTGIWPQVGLVAFLVMLNAAFAGSEIALISLREGQLRKMEAAGGSGRLVATLARDPNRFLATIQIGITLAGFLASATAAVTLAEPLVPVLSDLLGRAARPVSIVLVTAVLTFVTLVLGELAPKRLAMQRPVGWALLVARPLSLIATAARPAVWFLGRSTDLVVRAFGGDPSVGRDAVTADEIRDMVAAVGTYDRDDRRIITGALEATERVLRQVVRPRTVVMALQEDEPVDAAIRRLVAAGHSRAPVYRDGLDDADRTIHVLDLVAAEGTVGEHARKAPVLPESMGLVDGLRQLQRDHQSLALVVDEYGGIEGIVTVEDLVEELVGEIHDEYDRDVRAAERRDDGSVVVVGHFPVHDLVDLGIDAPEGEYVTVAGLVVENLQRLPRAGDAVRVAGRVYEVLETRGHAIDRVRIVAPEDAGPPGPDEG